MVTNCQLSFENFNAADVGVASLQLNTICWKSRNFIKQRRIEDTQREREAKREMTFLSTISYGLIAFGPMIVLFCVTVARKSHEAIVMMSA